MRQQVQWQQFHPQHFRWHVDGDVGVITLSLPHKKNPLTFDSYAELADTFRSLCDWQTIKAIVLTGEGGNFCSGGDVNDIIGPLISMSASDILRFTRLTGDLVKAMRACPLPIVSAIDGVCVGAGALLALASDFRFATPEAKIAFLFVRVGLAGCDMGACTLLPRVVGQGRAADLLFTGRSLPAEDALQWGLYQQIHAADVLQIRATAFAQQLADGPNFAHMMTKTMLNQEWSMSLEAAIEAEAQAQALCMHTDDFRRAYEAFIAKQKPQFQGN